MLDNYFTPKQIEENTLHFIRTYCQHHSKRNPRAPMKNERMINAHWNKMVRDYQWVDQDEVKAYLNNVNYTKVYLTSYWWYIIKHKRMLMDGFLCTDGRCKTPNACSYHVHHKTYDHRGEEIKFMDSIETLCNVCHDIRHQNDERPNKPKGRGKKRFRTRKPKFGKKLGVVELKKTEKVKDVDKPLEKKIKNAINASTEPKTLDGTKLMKNILDNFNSILGDLKNRGKL